MRTSALFVTACAFCSTLFLAGATAAAEPATNVQLAATMSATEAVPRPSAAGRAGRGRFSATARASGGGAVLSWRLTFSRLSGAATAAHIHLAPRGRAGPVAVPLCGPCRSGARGRTEVSASVRKALASGRVYVNVHTVANPAGEVRGQIGTVARAKTKLDARQELPEPGGRVGRARGVFEATVTRFGRQAVVSWRLRFSRLTGRGVAAHLHFGARGRTGAVAVALCGPCRSNARGQVTVRGAVLTALESGRLYVNVHTPRNPAGEIRGQLPSLRLTLTGGSDGGRGGGGGGGGGDDPPPYPPGNPYP